MNDFQKAVTFALVLCLCLSYCSNTPAKTKIYDAGIALSVERDLLTFAIERRLAALERVTISPKQMKAARATETPSAIDPVHYGTKNERPPE